jgi:hypothetical protein
MNIEDFISETLTQIISGVNKAQDALKKTSGCSIAPYGKNAEAVEFDVAVTAAESKESKGGLAVSVCSIGAGIQGASEASRSTVSRVKFAVKIQLPEGSPRPHNPQTTCIM